MKIQRVEIGGVTQSFEVENRDRATLDLQQPLRAKLL